MRPSFQTCIYKVLPDASTISTLIMKAWWEFIKALVNRLRRLQLRYNAKIIRGSGNSRLAKCFRSRRPGIAKKNAAKVVYAWCGTDGSLLQPVKAYRRADWSSVRDDLEPMLASIRKFGHEDGLCTLDTLPVGHSTDSYNRDYKRLAKLYDTIWPDVRMGSQVPTPLRENCAWHGRSARSAREEFGSRHVVISADPFHFTQLGNIHAPPHANDCRDFRYDHADIMNRLSAPNDVDIDDKIESKRGFSYDNTQVVSLEGGHSEGDSATGSTCSIPTNSSDEEADLHGNSEVDDLLLCRIHKGALAFKTVWSGTSPAIKSKLEKLLKGSNARNDECWVRLFGARPTRGVLTRLANSVGVQIDALNRFRNYRNKKDFLNEIHTVQKWYEPGRRESRYRARGIYRGKMGREVRGTRTVWNNRLSRIYSSMLSESVSSGLWNWRRTSQTFEFHWN